MDEFEKLLERLKEELGEDQITTASDSKIKRPERALERQAFDDFMDRNPLAGGGMLVQPSADGSRPGYAKTKKGYGQDAAPLTKEQKKIKDAFPNTKFDFDKYRYGVKKYPDIRNQNITNKDYTKVLRFIKKGYKLGKGEV